MEKCKKIFMNLILPGFIISGLTGIVVGIVVFFYKGCADYLAHLSHNIMDYTHTHLYIIPIILLVFIIVAFIQSKIVKITPISKGGGIPTSEGIIRGSLDFNPFKTLISTIFLSFISFFFSLPLGSEGPSVAIGTSLGAITSKTLPKKDKCFKRYIMTSGAATAFSVATGSVITGIIFSLEEIHRKFSPMILLISFSSVICGSVVAYVLSQYIDINYLLFSHLNITTLGMDSYLLMIPLGILIGFIAIIFNKLIKLFQNILDNKLNNVPTFIKLLFSFIITFIIGYFLKDFLGGGHSLIESLFENNYKIYILLILLLLKIVLIAWISQSGVTGGMFIPILSLGAIIGGLVVEIFHLESMRAAIIAIAMASFMASSIGCPLSGLVFAVEALGSHNNIIPLAICVFFSYITTRIFKVEHVYDVILERKLHKEYSKKKFQVIQLDVEVVNESFAVGHQVRDLLLPANTLVLSIRRSNKDYAKMDNFGDKIIKSNDIISIRAQSYNIDKTISEIEAFFGEQKNIMFDIIQS